jgi:hypothetical protein
VLAPSWGVSLEAEETPDTVGYESS